MNSPRSKLNSTQVRRAKIVCTLGPASNTEEIHRRLLRAGMNVARLNFSHGTHEEHARMIDRVRKAAQIIETHDVIGMRVSEHYRIDSADVLAQRLGSKVGSGIHDE